MTGHKGEANAKHRRSSAAHTNTHGPGRHVSINRDVQMRPTCALKHQRRASKFGQESTNTEKSWRLMNTELGVDSELLSERQNCRFLEKKEQKRTKKHKKELPQKRYTLKKKSTKMYL